MSERDGFRWWHTALILVGVTSPSTTPSASPPPLPRSGLGLIAQRGGRNSGWWLSPRRL